MAKQNRTLRRKNRRLYVFISHHGMDSWVAKRIEEKINLCGAKTFLDQTRLAVGDDFEKIILKELEKADEIVAILTPWALSRPYVWSELGHALKSRVRIIGVLYGVKPDDSALPQYMRERLLIDINDLEKYFAQLRARVESRKELR